MQHLSNDWLILQYTNYENAYVMYSVRLQKNK